MVNEGEEELDTRVADIISLFVDSCDLMAIYVQV